ncbi:LysE family translocator [Actinophytocola sp. NPDC049390]|uniref:LysE family translocator n=1 Tax=Actinophytocola sp. NPDC049390 TaxID=3363894 RepID=UPI0037A51235
MTVPQALALAGVILLAAMSPGPDFVIVLRSVLSGGRRAGMACAAGIASGVLAWAVVTSVGIAGLLAASAVAFTVVKLVGAAYLVLLGVQSLLAARRGGYEQTKEPEAERTRRGAFVAYRQGLLTNLFNPKVAVFFLALWPQFLPHDATVVDTSILAAVAAVTTLVWFTVLSNVVTVLRRFLTTSKVRRTIDAVMGTLLVGIGVRIAVSQ